MSNSPKDKPLSYYVKRSLLEYCNIVADCNSSPLYNIIINEVDKTLISTALEITDGNKLKAAKLLGVSRTTFYAKLKQYDVHS